MVDLPLEFEIRLMSAVKLHNKKQERFYRAEIRYFREDRRSRRRFLRATDALIYGQRWVVRLRRLYSLNHSEPQSREENEEEQ